MISTRRLELLQFHSIRELVSGRCYSIQARELALTMSPSTAIMDVLPELEAVEEMRRLLAGGGFFPTVEHPDYSADLHILSLNGAPDEHGWLRIAAGTDVANSVIRFLQEKRNELIRLGSLVAGLRLQTEVVKEIERVLDPDAMVKSSASPELTAIRKSISEKRRESDRRFYHQLVHLRKLGYLRENEEGFYNGRRTLAVISDHKSEVNGFIHGKSESGRTVFIEPAATVSINNEISELEIDERREVQRILRQLSEKLAPYTPELKQCQDVLVRVDFVRAKASLAVDLDARLPSIQEKIELKLVKAVHPLVFLQNRKLQKVTVPLSLELHRNQRILVISGPNAGGKPVALKTVGLLQIMLQAGMLIPVDDSSRYCFFDNILVDIGDTQSIENELSTYSGKLRSMTHIMEQANEASLVLLDEFGSGTDPELGGAIAEAVLENLVNSQALGLVTSHFGNIKVLAGKLEGAKNASMLFNAVTFEPRYMLSIGEPGSSYTFEVAERTGFPRHLIERAREKLGKETLNLGKMLTELQRQKSSLQEELQRTEREKAKARETREKYQQLFDEWKNRIDQEREKKIELSRLADYGRKYLRLMEDWNKKQDRKLVIKRFIDGITAETKKKEALKRKGRKDAFAEKKIARMRERLSVGSRVRVLNGHEIGVVEEIRDERVHVRFGGMRLTVGMENLLLAE